MDWRSIIGVHAFNDVPYVPCAEFPPEADRLRLRPTLKEERDRNMVRTRKKNKKAIFYAVDIHSRISLLWNAQRKKKSISSVISVTAIFSFFFSVPNPTLFLPYPSFLQIPYFPLSSLLLKDVKQLHLSPPPPPPPLPPPSSSPGDDLSLPSLPSPSEKVTMTNYLAQKKQVRYYLPKNVHACLTAFSCFDRSLARSPSA